MKVEILKDHESGLKKGQIKNVSIIDGRALISMELAIEVNESAEVKPKKTKKKAE